MQGTEKSKNTEDNFEYMEELSKAYREAFAKRIAEHKPELSEEKRNALTAMQWELARGAALLRRAFPTSEKQELAAMLKESAEECLRLLGYTESEVFSAADLTSLPLAAILTRAVMLANRSLNFAVRHAGASSQLQILILSELSVLYALAAIN